MGLLDRTVVHIVLLGLLGSGTLLVGLGQDADFGSREARHAEIAREMVERGESVVPYLLGQPYTLKPPLYNLTVARLYVLAGRVDILLARLPSAVAGIVLAVVAYLLGRRWYNTRTGLWAGGMVLAFPLVIFWGRTARPDMMMAAWIALGVLLADCAATAQSPRGSWLFWVGACLCVSAGILSKGAQAALFFAIAATALWRARRGRWAPPVPKVALALLLFLVVPVAWGIACEIRCPGYVRAILGYQFGTGLREHPKRPTLYVEELPTLTLPWSLFVFGAAWAAIRRLRQSGFDRVVAPGLIVLVCLACMTPVANRRVHYTLPFIPMWALFLAAFLDRAAGSGPGAAAEDVSPAIRRFLFLWPLRLALAGVVAAAAYALFWWAAHVGRGTAAIATVLACLAAGALYGLLATRRGQLARAVTALLALCLAIATTAYEANRRYAVIKTDPKVSAVDEILRAVPAGLPIAAFDVRSELLFFRLNRPVAFLPDEAALDAFLRRAGARCLILSAEGVLQARSRSLRPVRHLGTWRFDEGRVEVAVLTVED